MIPSRFDTHFVSRPEALDSAAKSKLMASNSPFENLCHGSSGGNHFHWSTSGFGSSRQNLTGAKALQEEVKHKQQPRRTTTTNDKPRLVQQVSDDASRGDGACTCYQHLLADVLQALDFAVRRHSSGTSARIAVVGIVTTTGRGGRAGRSRRHRRRSRLCM